MARDYVQHREGGYFVEDSRVSLDSVVYAFLRGESPEGIVESFPPLTLEQVMGALAFYLGNRDTVDAHLEQAKADFEKLRLEARRKNPGLYAKLAEAKQKSHRPRA